MEDGKKPQIKADKRNCRFNRRH